MSLRPYRPNPLTDAGRAYIRLKETCAKLREQIAWLKGSLKTRPSKCLRCGAGPEWLK